MNSPRHPRIEVIVRSGFSMLRDAPLPPIPLRARDLEAGGRAMAGRMDFALRAMPEAIGGRA